jgi:hypothetical protein
MVVSKMYSELSDDEKKYFQVYWYTGTLLRILHLPSY